MGVIETRTFKNGDGVAVQLPEALGIAPGALVTVEQVGDKVTIRPAADKTHGLSGALADIVQLWEDAPPSDARFKRQPIEFPDRPGLY